MLARTSASRSRHTILWASLIQPLARGSPNKIETRPLTIARIDMQAPFSKWQLRTILEKIRVSQMATLMQPKHTLRGVAAAAVLSEWCLQVVTLID